MRETESAQGFCERGAALQPVAFRQALGRAISEWSLPADSSI